jgi:uncharacterized membrane protein HdeD (DUF308 family)
MDAAIMLEASPSLIRSRRVGAVNLSMLSSLGRVHPGTCGAFPSRPVTAIWLLGVLLGIQLICEGAALGYLAWKVRAS